MLKKRTLQNGLLPLFFIIAIASFYSFFQKATKTLEKIPNKAIQPQQIMNDSLYSLDSLIIHQLDRLAWSYYNNARWDSTVYNGHKITEITEKMLAYRLDSTILKMHILGRGRAGQGKAHMGNYEEGLKEMLKSIDLFIEAFGEYDIALVYGYVGVGEIYDYLGDLEMTLFYMQKSLHVMNHIFKENHYYFGNKYSNIALVYYKLGEYEKAIEYYNKRIQNNAKTTPISAPFVNRQLAKTYLEKGDPNTALEYAQQSLNYKYNEEERNKQNISVGKSHALLGLIYSHLNNFSKAKSHLKKALAIHTIHESKSYKKEINIISDFSYLGDVFQKENKLDSALTFYHKAFDIGKQFYGERSLNLIPIYNNIGKIYVQKKHYTQALNQFQQSLNLLVPSISAEDIFENPSVDELSSIANLLKTLSLKAFCAKQLYLKAPLQKNRSLCLSTFRLSEDLLDKMMLGFNNQKSKQFLRTTARHFYEEAINLSYHLFEQTKDKQYLDLAFYYMEKSKAVILLAGLQESEAKDFSGIESSLLTSERKIKKELSLYKKLIFEEELKEKPDSIKLGFWFDRIVKLKSGYDSLSNTIQTNHPEYYRLQYDLKTVQIQDIQKKLKKILP